MNIDQIDLDLLREVANIGAGNAANALSVMWGQPVDINVPHCEIIGYKDIADKLGGAETVVLAMLVRMQGDIEGYVLFSEPLEEARTLMRDLAGKDITPNDSSVASYEDMREIANILVGTYLSAIAEMAHLQIVPSIPEMTIDMTMAIMNIPVLMYGETSDTVLLLDAEFGGSAKNVNGSFFMIPTPESLVKLRKALLGTE